MNRRSIRLARNRNCRRTRRLRLETLEKRLLLANIRWNTDSDGFWDEPQNWLDDQNVSRLPAVADQVEIDRGAANPIVTIRSGEQVIDRLDAREGLVLSGGRLAISNPSAIHESFEFQAGTLEADGTLELRGNTQWTGGTLTGDASIRNLGSLTLAAGTATVANTTLVNEATIVQASGSLNLANAVLSNTSAGLYSLTGDFGISGSGGSISNAGVFRKSAGTQTSTVTVAVDNPGTVDVHSGTLSLTGAVTQHVGSTLTGGAWQVGAGATLNFATGVNITTNQGIVTLSGSGSTFARFNSLSSNAGTLRLLASRDFTTVGSLTNSGVVELGDGSDLIATSANVTNTGTIRKIAGGASVVNTPDLLEKGGTFAAETGSLSFPGSIVTLQGTTFSVNENGLIDLSGTSRRASGTIVGTGAGMVLFGSGTLFGDSIGATETTFNFAPGVFRWTGGTIQHTSSSGNPRSLTNSGNMTLEGPISKLVAGSGGSLINTGTITQAGGGELFIGLFATLDNRAGGILDLRSEAGITVGNAGNGGTLKNSGVVRKSAGGPSAIVIPGILEDSGGQYDVQTSTLTIRDLSSSSRGVYRTTNTQFNVATGALLDLQLEFFSVGGVMAGSGGGRVTLSSGTMFVEGAAATLNFPAGLFHWTGGKIQHTTTGSNPRTITNTGSITLTGTVSKLISGSGGSLINTGTITQAGEGELFIGLFATLDNQAGGIIDLRSDAGITVGNAGNGGTLKNSGVVRKSAGGPSAIVIPGVLEDSGGRYEVQTASLTFRDPAPNLRGRYQATNTQFDVALGAAIDLQLAFLIVGQEMIGSGAGTVTLSSGTMFSATGGATLNFPAGMFQWTGGSIQHTTIGSNPQTITNVNHITIAGASIKQLIGSGGALANTGTIIHSAGLELNLSVFSTLENRAGGHYEMLGDGFITGSGVFSNAGLLIKTAGSGEALMRVLHNQNGTVEVRSGRLALDTVSAVFNGGNFVVASDSVFELRGHLGPFKGAFTGSGSGRIELNPNNAAGDLTIGADGATFDFPDGLFHWKAGLIFINSSDKALTNRGHITLSSDLSKTLRGAMTNTGTMVAEDTLDLGIVRLSVLDNPGLIDVRGNGRIFLNPVFPLSATIRNGGVFRKSGGDGALTFNSVFPTGPGLDVDNIGTIEALAGTIDFATPTRVLQHSDNTLTGGSWVIGTGATLAIEPGATIRTNQANVTLAGADSSFAKLDTLGTNTGTFHLTGGRDFTTVGNFTNSGSVTLDAGSTLAVTGDYTQASDLTVDIGGDPASGLFGQLAASGVANLDGEFTTRLANGFAPSAGQTFTVMSFSSHTGTFDAINGLTDAGGAQLFSADLTTTNLILNGEGNATRDLAVVSVTPPPTVVIGRDVTIPFVVRNLGSGQATGAWLDSLYLSRDGVLDPSDVLLGRVPHTGPVASLTIYEGSLTARLPAVVEGDYRVIVVTDSRLQVPDTNRANNTAASANALTANVPLLTLGETTTGAIANGEDLYFRVDVPAGRDVELVANFGSSSAAEFFASYFVPPDRSNADHVADDLVGQRQRILLASPQAGPHYVLLHGREGASDIGFDLTARQLTFQVNSISPPRGSNVGQVTTAVRGAGFTLNSSASLIDSDGSVRDAVATFFIDSITLAATFDLTGLTPGQYDVRVSDGPKETTAENLYTVNTAAAGQLDLRLSVPTFARAPFRGAAAIIEYANIGQTDIEAPLLRLESNNARFRARGFDPLRTGGMLILGINQTGLAGVLPPDVRGTIRIPFEAEVPGNTTADFELSVADPATPIDWASFKDDLKPTHVGDDAWDVVFSNFVAEVGTTFGEFHSMLLDNARRLSELGIYITDVNQLLDFELYQADDFGAISSRFALGVFGRGQTDPISVRAVVESNGDVTITSPGGVRRFLRQLEGSFLGVDGDQGATVVFANDELVVREQNGLETVFNLADGRVLRMQEPDGLRLTYEYAGNLLQSITDDFGDATLFQYNGFGRVSQIIDALEQVTTFTYDASGEHLLTISDMNGMTTYTYDTSGTPALVHAIRSVTNPAGYVAMFDYDDRGRLVRTLDPATQQDVHLVVDTAGGLTEIYSGVETFRFFRDHLGQVPKLIDPSGLTAEVRSSTDGSVITAVYGGTTRVVTEFNQNGFPVTLTDPLGSRASLEFDANGFLIQVTDPLMNVTQYIHDDAANVTTVRHPDGSEETFEEDAFGNLAAYVNRRRQRIKYEYDANNFLTRKILPDGSTFEYAYDAAGRLTSVVEAIGRTTYEYDAAGRLIRVTYPTGRFLEYEYDAAGRRTRLTNQDGYEQNYVYDAAGRLVELVDQSDQRIVAYAFDAVGRLARKDFGNGALTGYTYDSASRPVLIENLAPDGSSISRFVYRYNAFDEVVTAMTPEGEFRYEYDLTGRLVSMLTPGGRVIGYDYDASGNRVTVTDGGTPTVYAVNELNQYISAGGVTYAYDLDGNLVAETKDGVTTAYTYDADGRLVRIDSPDEVLEFEYDAFGNRTALTRNGVRTEYLLDPTGLTDVVAEYDSDGNILAHYAHGLGLAGRIAPDGSQAFYHFDVVGSTTEVTGAGGNILNQYRYLPFGESLQSTESISNPFQFVGEYGVMRDAAGHYYMRVREYNAALGRFDSPDPQSLAGAEQLNPYSYAGNQPTTSIDPVGLRKVSATILNQIAERTRSQMDTGYGTVGQRGFLAPPSQFARDHKANYEQVLKQIKAKGPVNDATLDAGIESAFKYRNSQMADARGKVGIPSNTNGVLKPEYAKSLEKSNREAQRMANKLVNENLKARFKQAAATAVKSAIKQGIKAVPILGAVVQGAELGGLVIDATVPTIVAEENRQDVLGPLGIPGFGNKTRDKLRNCGGLPPELCAWAKGQVARGKTGYIAPTDPNDITGPQGALADAIPAGALPPLRFEGFVAPDQPFAYRIRFENKASATAPAQVVTISDQLDADFDFASFELGAFGFGDIEVQVPAGRSSFSTQIALPAAPATGGEPLLVDMVAGINLLTGLVTWTFTTLDPGTGDLPANPLAGFLPPNVTSPQGEGFVHYLVRRSTSLSNGSATRIDALATIVFDTEAPLDTPAIFNTIDALPPDSRLEALPANAAFGLSLVTLNWSGEDDVGGSGLAAFDLFVSEDGAPPTTLLAGTTSTSLALQLERGHEYAFFTTARDNVGFVEVPPVVPDVRLRYIGPPWHSPRDPLDVNDDGLVVPLDVLLIINELNLPKIIGAGGELPLPPPTLDFQKPFFDVNGDNFVTPLDALVIINFLNQIGGEGESASLAFDPQVALSNPIFISVSEKKRLVLSFFAPSLAAQEHPDREPSTAPQCECPPVPLVECSAPPARSSAIVDAVLTNHYQRPTRFDDLETILDELVKVDNSCL